MISRFLVWLCAFACCVQSFTYEPYFYDGNDPGLLRYDTIIYEYKGLTNDIVNFMRGGGNLVLSFVSGLRNSNVACAIAESGATGINFFIDDIIEDRNVVSLSTRRTQHMDPELLEARKIHNNPLFKELLDLRVNAVMDQQRAAVKRNVDLIMRLQAQLTNIRWTLAIEAVPIFGIDRKVYKILRDYVEQNVRIHVVNVIISPDANTVNLLEQIALQIKFIAEKTPNIRSPYKMMGVTLREACSQDEYVAIQRFMASKNFVFLSTTEDFRMNRARPKKPVETLSRKPTVLF